MNEEMFFELIGYADDRFLTQCEKKRKRLLKTPKWFNMLAGVALAYIVIMPLINLTFYHFMLNLGRKAVTPFDSTQISDEHHFDYYDGPLLPLTTTLENTDDISVSRDILIDFSEYDRSEDYPYANILLTDTYTLTNNSDTRKTFNIYYPYCVNDLNNFKYQTPHVKLNGESIYPNINAGKYAPDTYLKFMDNDFYRTRKTTLNNYREYISLLYDGTLNDTLSDFDALSDVSVIEYTFSNNFHLNHDNSSTAYVKCNLDNDKSKFLVDDYFSEWERTDNKTVSFKINWSYSGDDFAHLYIIGDDIENISFANGIGNPVEASDITMTRTEKKLEDVLYNYALSEYNYWIKKAPSQSADEIRHPNYLNFDEYYQLYCECIDYIIKNPEIYEEINEIEHITLERIGYDLQYISIVCYLSTDITLDAGEMITVSFDSKKFSSHNFKTMPYTNHYSSISYYDILTDTGSNFSFTEITSRIINYQNIDIIKQNLGFQIKKKVTDISLDTENTHYYMLISNKRYYNKYRHHWYDWWTIPKYYH